MLYINHAQDAHKRYIYGARDKFDGFVRKKKKSLVTENLIDSKEIQ